MTIKTAKCTSNAQRQICVYRDSSHNNLELNLSSNMGEKNVGICGTGFEVYLPWCYKNEYTTFVFIYISCGTRISLVKFFVFPTFPTLRYDSTGWLIMQNIKPNELPRPLYKLEGMVHMYADRDYIILNKSPLSLCRIDPRKLSSLFCLP